MYDRKSIDKWMVIFYSIEEGEEVKSSSRVQLFATPWTVACQASLSMGFSRQEYWNGLPFPSPDRAVLIMCLSFQRGDVFLIFCVDHESSLSGGKN